MQPEQPEPTLRQALLGLGATLLLGVLAVTALVIALVVAGLAGHLITHVVVWGWEVVG